MEQNKHDADVSCLYGGDIPPILTSSSMHLTIPDLRNDNGISVCSAEIPERSEVTVSMFQTIRTLPIRGIELARRAKINGLEIARAAKIDIKESEHKFHAAASLLGVIAVEAVGFTRAPTLLSLPLAVKLEKETGIPVIAGIAAGTLYGAWCYTAARAINSGVNHLPRTFEAANSHLPSVDKVSKVLPGLEPATEQKAQTRACRGLAVYSTGTGLYVLAAGLQNQTQTERNKLCANLGRDGGTFLGVLAMLATGAVLALQQKEPALGEQILEKAGDAGFLLKVLIGATVAKLAGGWAINKVKRLWNNRREELVPVPVN